MEIIPPLSFIYSSIHLVLIKGPPWAKREGEQWWAIQTRSLPWWSVPVILRGYYREGKCLWAVKHCSSRRFSSLSVTSTLDLAVWFGHVIIFLGFPILTCEMKQVPVLKLKYSKCKQRSFLCTSVSCLSKRLLWNISDTQKGKNNITNACVPTILREVLMVACPPFPQSK